MINDKEEIKRLVGALADSTKTLNDALQIMKEQRQEIRELKAALEFKGMPTLEDRQEEIMQDHILSGKFG